MLLLLLVHTVWWHTHPCFFAEFWSKKACLCLADCSFKLLPKFFGRQTVYKDSFIYWLSDSWLLITCNVLRYAMYEWLSWVVTSSEKWEEPSYVIFVYQHGDNLNLHTTLNLALHLYLRRIILEGQKERISSQK